MPCDLVPELCKDKLAINFVHAVKSHKDVVELQRKYVQQYLTAALFASKTEV